MRRILIAVLRIYQWLVSPLLGPCCRFYPSCSDFAVEAVRQHGVMRGLMLASWRLLRCHPWHPGGVDPVPASLSTRDECTSRADDPASTTAVHHDARCRT